MPTAGYSSAAGSSPKFPITVSIQQINNGFILNWYSPLGGNQTFFVTDLATVDTKLAEIFGLGTS